ncbi:MAG: hypothetical protein KDB22_09660 [Planctomycetales bacterium]|nr:hypothetical protein [Planctomycetales bacterium]
MLATQWRVMAAIFLGMILTSSQVSQAQQLGSNNSAEQLDSLHVVDLEDQLKNGLRVVTPQQLQFVKTVVLYVDKKRIPRAMVNLVYRWSLEKHESVPFPYFEFAMRALAKRRGVLFPT